MLARDNDRKEQPDYRQIFQEMSKEGGPLGWLFDPGNELINERVKTMYESWLKENNFLDQVKSNPAADEHYTGVFFTQNYLTIEKMRANTLSSTAASPVASQAPAVLQPKTVVFDKIKIDVKHEYFETEQGQWMLWFIFLALTILDWLTNVWALSQRLDMAVGLESASIWHWILGGVLVFSEIYLGLVRTLWRRTPKDRAQEVVILVVLWIIVLLAIGYDFVATLIPPYNAIGGIGGVITGLLLAGITTVGSSYFLQQSQIVWQLFKQRVPKK